MATLSAEEQAKIAKQIKVQNELLDAQIAKEEELKKLQGERLRQIDKDIEASGKQVEYAQERLNATAQALQISKEHGDQANEDTLARLRTEMELHKESAKNNKISQEELATKQKTFDMMEDILSLTEKELEHARDLAEVEKERAKNLNKQKRAAKEIGEAMKDMVGSSTGISDAWKTRDGLAGSFTRSIEAGGDLTETLSELGNGIADAINPTNFLASAFLAVVDSTKELFFEMDTVLAEFKRGTGLSKEYSDSLLDVRQNQVHLGYGMREIAEQFGDLTTANSAFVFQNKAARESLMNQTAAMGMAFDASSEFAEAVGFATTALAQAPDVAAKTTRGLATFAQSIKASPKEMMRDYAALAPRLAAWGDKATQVFKETAAAAKALNMETSAMLDIADQFDTFEGAADQVGQLNAVLGGDYFDTVEMVNASESERIELLMEGVRATGKSWESLGRFEKKAVASAAGITDMAQANKLFGQNLDVYRELQSFTDDAAMSYSDLSDAAKENMSIQEKLGAITKSLAVSLGWLVDSISWLLGGILTVAEATGKFFPFIVLGLGVLLLKLTSFGSILTFLAKPLVMLAGGLKSLIPGFAGATTASGGFLTSFTGFLTAMQGSAQNMLAFGGMILMVGGGISLAALGLAELVSSFVAFGENIAGMAFALGAVIVVMGGFALLAYIMVPALAGIAAAGGAAVLPLLGIGAAFALMGFGIYLAAIGLAELVTSFGTLGENALQTSAALIAIVYTMGGFIVAGVAMAAAIGVLSVIAFFASGPLMTLGLAFLALGAGIALAAWGTNLLMGSFTELSISSEGLISSLQAIKDLDSISLSAVSSGIEDMASAVDKLNEALADTNIDILSALNSEGLISALQAIESLNSISFSAVSSGIGDVATAVDKLNEALADTDIDKLRALNGAGSFNINTNKVSANAQGSTGFTGTSMVGEEGPEIITTRNANIISNENIVRLVQTNEKLTTSAAQASTAQMEVPSKALEELVSKLLGHLSTQSQQPSKQAPPPAQPIQVILEVDGTKIGKTIIEPYLEGRLKPKLSY